ncbi:hypothetical protein [Amycolatopsis rubida]|uniref:hypothetical protein n=1 Tax=Amycolatopsis rubida TaxID=112413 RepID=UPI000AE589B9|nr:hypothetical protein [Amycolatopsis rubida]MYW96310.1 hypothetical protein [Amycolatopsis rubida]
MPRRPATTADEQIRFTGAFAAALTRAIGSMPALYVVLALVAAAWGPLRAVDRRSVQTYENAEAVFEQIADLQRHLDQHDRTLSRGVSLLESSPHPWIQQHRPPQALDPGGERQQPDRGQADAAAWRHGGVLPGGRDAGGVDGTGRARCAAAGPVLVRVHDLPVHAGPAGLHDRDHGRPGRRAALPRAATRSCANAAG